MSDNFKLKTIYMDNQNIELGSLVRVIKINKSGVVIGKVGDKKWLVAFPTKISLPYHESELEVNNLI